MNLIKGFIQLINNGLSKKDSLKLIYIINKCEGKPLKKLVEVLNANGFIASIRQNLIDANLEKNYYYSSKTLLIKKRNNLNTIYSIELN